MTDSSSAHRDSGDAVSPTQQSPISPGGILRAARENAGLSREELSQRLCIIDNTIEWLEEDIFERQPEMVYARGYIRNICRELGVNSEPALTAYEGARPQPQVRSQGRRIEVKADALRPARKRGHGLLAMLPLLAAGGVFWWLYGGPVTIPSVPMPAALSEEAPLSPSETSIQSVSSPVLENSAGDEGGVTPPQEEPAEHGVLEVASEPPAESAAAFVSQPEVNTTEPAQELATEVAQLDQKLQGALRLSFDEDSWIEVKDAGGVVLLAGVQEAGTSKELDGRAPFEVMLGNAGATKVVYREQTIDSDPIGNRRTRRLIVGD
ncbi:RodZ domain-containing protein [Microbulbifer sp. GL-2]|uniref:RodZ domain-containing protein n=1 Tax=Microbulbifer sp. GL-2 TaxID=2591606 RepID=UPI001164A24A|nr:RodZ domain-containing protein [Microbulbifer sp. GL-2]BBM00301.1 transcriptional regulator [Microbulbifer sp. GL-2]